MISAPDRGSRVQALIPIARARNAFEIKRESCGSFISPTPVHSRRETGHIYRIKLRLSSWCPIIPAEAREDFFVQFTSTNLHHCYWWSFLQLLLLFTNFEYFGWDFSGYRNLSLDELWGSRVTLFDRFS